ncbi:hypothetical protein BV22DRAFT_1025531 [Leucogyrophana mollusca]|uniref:Uncharacterized protein n=1 Tax=Leucogyrophana mollusca TaxID=85980 RepID=A0ACB8AZ75_9AGAM|nr:hypothetical protein BV22DRAFT_1025531 [Leucogyrophana mollusca]
MPESSLSIPLAAGAALLPDPHLPLNVFLSFRLPTFSPQSASITVNRFFSEADPLPLSTYTALKDLPIPNARLIETLEHHIQNGPAAGQRSIVYAHVPRDMQPGPMPLWAVSLWIEVARLRKAVREPWASMEQWVSKQKNTYHSPTKRQLCDMVTRRMSSIPWAGGIHGFSHFEPISTLATYLSSNWLCEVHIAGYTVVLVHEWTAVRG